jgi:hypothetical protein
VEVAATITAAQESAPMACRSPLELNLKQMSIKQRIEQWFCRQLFARGYVVIPIARIERLEWSALANHAAQKKHRQDSWDHGYFNGLADMASKTAYELRQFYPAGCKDEGPRARRLSGLSKPLTTL